MQTYLRAGVTGLITMDMATASRQAKLKKGVWQTLRRLNLHQGRTWAGKRLTPPFVSWEAMNRTMHLALENLQKRENTAWRKEGA